jgi:peptidyl-prolyl cis-trans isomerase SurA
MKFILTFITIFFLSVKAYSDNVQKLDRIVAIINNSVIIESELDDEMNKVKKQLKAENTSLPPGDILQKQVLDQLINKKLQLQLAEQAGIEPTDSEIDNAIRNIAKNNHLTVEQLYTELAKRGLSRSEYQKNIHDEYIIQQVQHQAVGGKITVSDQEVDDFMRSAAWLASTNKEYHLEDILISLPEAPTSEDITVAKKHATLVLQKLKQGKSFHDIAIAESNDSKALQGGDLGFRKLPEIPSAFAAVILQAQEGDILGPIQAANGFHIIRLVQVRQALQDDKNKNPQKNEIKKLLYERKYEEARNAWLTKIRSEAFINTNP